MDGDEVGRRKPLIPPAVQDVLWLLLAILTALLAALVLHLEYVDVVTGAVTG